MSPNRREVLAGLGGATIAYVVVGCSPESELPSSDVEDPRIAEVPFQDRPQGQPNRPGVDFREWIIISSDGTASVFTSRTEIGQGLTTVLHDLVGQALDLPRERVKVVLGDTALCPADGPTTGSAATRYVAWAFWLAAHQVKADLVLLAAQKLGRSAEDLEYRAGEIFDTRDSSTSVGIGDLADGQVRRVSADPDAIIDEIPAYVDDGSWNVNAEAIVTGSQKYTADHYPEGCVYGAYVPNFYHHRLSRVSGAGLGKARRTPGVLRAQRFGNRVFVIGETYTAVQNGIEATSINWVKPQRPRGFDVEAEVRAGAELKWEVEQKGETSGIESSHTVIKETYATQFMTQVPIETDTAIADRTGRRMEVHVCSQNPFFARQRVARQERLPEERIRVITPPVGGAFGSKAGNVVAEEAAYMTRVMRAPVKYIYSRRDDVMRRSRFKEKVFFDVTSGLDRDGRLVARTIDVYQDEGHGTIEVYDIPNVRTRLYQTDLPVGHGTMRGTSFVQNVYGLESHTDMVARAIGEDPLEFRRRTITLDAFLPLIDSCAERLDYGSYQAPPGNGLGFAICHHGGRQLGVVGVEVSVDRASGRIAVERMVGAFDIGLVINRRLAANGIKGAMIWGLGAALLEEVELDGHRCRTTGFRNYRIPRISDVPPIDIDYFDNVRSGSPRGCGEVPVPPTVAAIANAVYDATGVRFYELPMTPERVKAALA